MPERIVIVGSGWGGYTLAHHLDDKKFEILVVSPEAATTYTPLLASAACGLFNVSLAAEPIRHKSKNIKFMQAYVKDVNFGKKTCHCVPAFKSLEDKAFDLEYDKLVITPGSTNQTFGTPGVFEHALFLKTVKDAIKVRARLRDVLEMASLPNVTDEERKGLLRFIIVGGGPIGVEVSAELSDLIRDDLVKLYPGFKDFFSVEIHDVADQILPVFDEELGKHARKSFLRKDVQVHTGSHITEVKADRMFTKEQGEIPFGMLVWATGNKQVSLVDTLDVSKSEKLPRILTDKNLIVLDKSGEPIEGVYAIGDAADIKDASLPPTAEVACQKGDHVGECINTGKTMPFDFADRAMVAYTGDQDGVVSGGDKGWSGSSAWLAWRAKNLDWSRSWRNRILIGVNWGLNHVFGKENARI